MNVKLRKTLIMGVISCALLLPALPINTYAVSLDKMVPKELAQKAAAAVLINAVGEGETTGWNKQTRIGVAEDVYDPSGQLVAYRFNFQGSEGQAEGYSLISSFADEEPVLMWTENKALDEEAAEAVAMSKIQSESRSFVAPKVEQSKLVWYGGIKLAVEVESNTGDEVAVDDTMRAYSLTGVETEAANESYPEPAYNEGNRAKWKQFESIVLAAASDDVNGENPWHGVTSENPGSWETNYKRIDKNYINGVKSLKQWDYASGQATGCSPTAGSNIVMWFAQQYPSLNPTGDARSIALELRKTMNTYQDSNGTGLTNYLNIPSGLQQYMREHGVPTAYAKNISLAIYSEYGDRIDVGAPVLQSYWDQSHYGNHTVTVVGYKEYVRNVLESNSKYLVVKNNWTSEPGDYYVKWGTWNTNIMTYVYVKGN